MPDEERENGHRVTVYIKQSKLHNTVDYNALENRSNDIKNKGEATVYANDNLTGRISAACFKSISMVAMTYGFI